MNELSKGIPALVLMKIVSRHNTSLIPSPSYLHGWEMKAWYTLFAHMPDFNHNSVNLWVFCAYQCFYYMYITKQPMVVASSCCVLSKASVVFSVTLPCLPNAAYE